MDTHADRQTQSHNKHAHTHAHIDTDTINTHTHARVIHQGGKVEFNGGYKALTSKLLIAWLC